MTATIMPTMLEYVYASGTPEQEWLVEQAEDWQHRPETGFRAWTRVCGA